MLNKCIHTFLQQYRIHTDARFLLGVSGGADSMALLHLFQAAGLNFEVVHCNFNLRGSESDQDEEFVVQYCTEHRIPINRIRFNTREYAKEKGISIEMAARELRYIWFAEIKQQKKADYIAVGHHADDLAETVFINFCRGTGIKGLSGIKAVAGDIIRPLLPYSSEEIIRYNQEHNIAFRTDSTNHSDEYMRNLIRHKVIPVFKEINPSFLHTVQENCHILRETERIFDFAIEQLKKEVTEQNGEELLIHMDKTMESPAPATLLHEILTPYGFNDTQIKDILSTYSAVSGKCFFSSEYTITKDRIYWRLFRTLKNGDTHLEINKEGRYSVQGMTLDVKIMPKGSDFQIPTSTNEVCFDKDKIRFPLVIRNWKKGDFFHPIGMKGRKKKLSDFFQNLKFSAKQKNETLVLMSGENIIWVVGHRTDEYTKITPETKEILRICIQ
ncbi:tRNA lysidine(34) synthetase TilS [Odoribacter sp. OttesenSCG-928-J03]|nr:tRNA lysidine(34) synthetase TilS [Odoribacter sp. OttesenSCG-928-J03]MDL2330630.1 tRNA lysidine(34) synthetase TilS [Odoribacter sp. OttesenSCG-928-A06]